jgi:hypothetical protein
MKLQNLFENEQATMQFWHGGNLDNEKSIKSGRWEYGPGLYLITHYQTAKKYAKGNRKLYLITVAKGNDSENSYISFDSSKDFIETYCIKNKRKEIIDSLQKYNKDGFVRASILINLIVNLNAIRNSEAKNLTKFLVDSKIDYTIVDNPFGWNKQKMMVLFNMAKIVDKKVITSKDKIEQFDLA